MPPRAARLAPARLVVGLGLCNFLNFAAFIPAQSFTTIVFGGGVGAAAVIALYAVFFASNLVAPLFIRERTCAAGLTLGAAGYLPFVAAIATGQTWLLFVGAVTVGVGASALWTSIGVAVTMLSDQSTRGRRFSLFGGVSRMNFVGNMVVGLSLQSGLGRATVFWVLFGVNVLAVCGFFLFGRVVLEPRAAAAAAASSASAAQTEIRNDLTVVNDEDGPTRKKSAAHDDDAADSAPIEPTGRTTSRGLGCWATLMQVPSYFLHLDFVPHLVSNLFIFGILKGWVYGTFTTWSPDGDASSAFMMGLFGMSMPVSGLAHGLAFDKLRGPRGKAKALLLPLALAVCGFALAFVYRSGSGGDGGGSTSLYFAAGVLLGLQVGGAEAVINAATSFLFPETSNSAFAARLTADCLGMILGYLIEPIAGISLPRHVALIAACLGLNAVAVVAYLAWGSCPWNPQLGTDSETESAGIQTSTRRKLDPGL